MKRKCTSGFCILVFSVAELIKNILPSVPFWVLNPDPGPKKRKN
jgi:hypothetical protein